MATMDRRTLMMNWDGLAENNIDDDLFFDSLDRISSAIPLDMRPSRSEDDADCRLSFASCVSSASFLPINDNFWNSEAPPRCSFSILQDYGVWTGEPGDIIERRKRLLQGMGLTSSNKGFLRLSSSKIMATMSRKIDTGKNPSLRAELEDSKKEPSCLPSARVLLVRSKSEGDIEFYSLDAKKRKEELIGPVSKQRITRTSSVLIATNTSLSHYANFVRISQEKRSRSLDLASLLPGRGFSTFFLIKDLDTGKEFIVKELNENGLWNKLSDLETGKQFTMDEFEKYVGFSPVVKEVMRRENGSKNLNGRRKVHPQSYLSKSFRNSKRRGVALLKNIKGVANSMTGLIVDKEREYSSAVNQKAGKNSSQWVKVRQHGKSYKEFTALYSCQEIQAHQGSIWTIKFSSDARFLASAGEDRVIHVWEVQESDVLSTMPSDNLNSVTGTPVHPMAGNISEQSSLPEFSPMPSKRRKKWKSFNKRKENSMPGYVNLPETVFGLSEKPVCTFKGHLDDVLDLSWSREQLLLSSSMDKTVRLWDLATGSCLRLFPHNGYVTCVQFNPANDDYFISGSLDSKVRIWSVTHRQVVDWTDIHEMVTAACFTPDGKGAIVGSHRGNSRLYAIDDYRLVLKDLIHIKKKNSPAKKVTGIQCSPCNPTEVLITSADSRIRILDGSDIIHKFKGLRNSGSQISASFTPEGKFIVSASEDNHVFISKQEDPRNAGASGKGKNRITTHAHEYFQCKDVSVAIPWPGSRKNEPPLVELRSKKHSRRSYTPPQPDIFSPIEEERKRRLTPPLPKKHNTLVRISSCPEEDLSYSTRIDSGIGDSSFHMYTDSTFSSCNSQPLATTFLLDHSSSHGVQTVQANAWGLVIVTATLEGEIRVYQNFGLPLKVSRRPIPSKISHKDSQV